MVTFIRVMGPTWAGKSTVNILLNIAAAARLIPIQFINALLPIDSQQRMVVNHGWTSTISDPRAAEIDSFADHPQVRGRRLLLLDTPGFDDRISDFREGLRYEMEIIDCIARCLKDK